MAKASPAADKRINRRVILKAGTALAAAGPALLRGGHAEAQLRADRARALFAYVGAFTTPERKGHGGGINVYRVDPTSGAWTHEQLLEIVNPSFLTLDWTQRFLYAVHADLEEVSAHAIDKQNGRITALNRQSCGGKNPVHLSIDPTGRWIVTANYGAGSVGVVPVEKDGSLGPRSDLVNLPGEPGPDRKQQASSHPHDVVFDPSGRFIAVPDKGLDRIFVFRLDATSGKLTPADPPLVATRAGAGPRHIAFHPQMPFAYVINELSSSVATYRFDPQRGALQPIQILPSLPASYTGNNTGAEIVVAPAGRVVYASNRGHDSIAIFAVDQSNGTLTPVGWALTHAKSPRFFCLDPTAEILYAANADEGFSIEQNTDTIVAFSINQANGMLTPTGQVIKTSSPCTIVFAGA
ncbi:lactonase family protein [Bradyrhizobium sp. ISRA464]|uniref:lactonase family protein n=1 Tax=Bradyrhizobium sp. ISRA464 TaxID=2866200 RepID=UPI0024793B32|nr:lactonase family protein [Bradyrhizobium sp. ISRA464]WGS25603.1 lactonase family protein [Bradyrhizobium sp. ISRA464]